MAQHAREEREATDYLSSIDDARKRKKESFPYIQVMVIPPLQKPYPTSMMPHIDEFKRVVGADSVEILTTSPIHEGALCIVDEEAKEKNKPINPVGSIVAGLGIYDSLYGVVVVAGSVETDGGRDFTSCPVDLRIRLLSIYA